MARYRISVNMEFVRSADQDFRAGIKTAAARPSTVLKGNYNQFANLFFSHTNEVLKVRKHLRRDSRQLKEEQSGWCGDQTFLRLSKSSCLTHRAGRELASRRGRLCRSQDLLMQGQAAWRRRRYRTETCAFRTFDNTPGVLDRATAQVPGRSPERRRCPIHADSGKSRRGIGLDNKDQLARSQIVPMTN